MGRCEAYITIGVVNEKDEMPAPCFWGQRKYLGGVVGGFIWFCSSSLAHSWEVDEDHVE